MFEWSFMREEWGETRVFTLHVSKNSKYHSQPTRSIFLFPIQSGNTLRDYNVSNSGGETRRRQGEKNGWTAGNKCKHMLQSDFSECVRG